MLDAIKITRKQALPIIQSTFPDYTGRKIKIEFTDKVTFYDTNWSGGTRNYYVALRSDGSTRAPYIPAPWINTVEGSKVELPENVLIIMHSYFCGSDMGITIYANPCYAPKLLAE